MRTFAYFVSHDLAACFRQVTEFSRLIVSDPVASERDSHTDTSWRPR